MTPLLLTAALLQPAPPLDASGDPLPPGAVLRIGTTRLRPGGSVTSLAFTPDGKKLVTATVKTGVQVWDVASGKQLHSLPLPRKSLRWAVVSADGRRAIMAGGGECLVVEVPTGKVLSAFSELKELHSASLSRDGTWVAVCSGDLVLLARVGDKAFSHTLIARFGLDSGMPLHAIITPNGKSLAIYSLLGSLNRASVDDIKVTGKFAAPDGSEIGRHPTFSPDGKSLAARRAFGSEIDLFETCTGKHLRTLADGECEPRALCFSPDGRSLLAADERGRVTVWDLGTGKIVRRLGGHHGSALALAVSPDSRTVATAGSDLTVRLWDLASGKPLHAFTDQPAFPTLVRFSPDGERLVCQELADSWRDTGTDGLFRSYDAATGKPLGQLPWRRSEFKAAALSADGRIVVLVDDRRALVRAAATGKPVFAVQLRTAWGGQNPELTPDGKRLILSAEHPRVGDTDFQCIQLWEVVSGKKIFDIPTNIGDRWHLSADGRTLYIRHRGDDLPGCSVYDTVTGQGCRWPAPAALLDGNLVASHGRLVALLFSGKLRVFDVGAAKVVRGFPVEGLTNAVAFAPGGRLLAAGADDGRVLIWDLKDGRQVAALAGHRGAVCSLDWSPDGSRLVSSGLDTTVVVWDAAAWPGPTAEAR